MDYLRTLGSAAVSTLVQKSGLNLPFALGNKVTSFGFCTLYDGTKRVCVVSYFISVCSALHGAYLGRWYPSLRF